MAAANFFLWARQALNANAQAAPGAKLYFYATGTSTPQAVYTTSALTTQHTNPVVANSAGIFANIYMDDTLEYRVVLTDSAGVSLAPEIDPYTGGIAGETGAKGAPGSPGEGYATIAAITALTAAGGDDVYLALSPRYGKFIFSATNLATRVSQDPKQGVYLAPNSDTTGASGAWIREEFLTGKYLRPEWFGATGGSDDTDAVQACDEALREWSEVTHVLLSDIYVTRGFGGAVSKATYATKADATAALGGLSAYDVVSVTTDESYSNLDTRYRVIGGALVGITGTTSRPLSRNSLNGKMWKGAQGSAKRTGFKLLASQAAWMPLFADDVAEGGFVGVGFDGNNPSSQWPGYASLQNNTATLKGVIVEGYGLVWDNTHARFFKNVAADFTGIIGNFQVSGGASYFGYSGTGVLVNQMCGLTFHRLWVEGNDVADVHLKFDMLAADSNIATKKTYWSRSSIHVMDAYCEQDTATVPVFLIEGGHISPVVTGPIALQGTSASAGRVVYKLANNASSDNVFKGCQGGKFDVPAQGCIVICESEARGNTFLRYSAMFSDTESSVMSFQDAGKNNVIDWYAPDAAVYTPGKDVSGLTFGGSTNFTDMVAVASGTATVTYGSRLDPIGDYHPDGSTGPSFMRNTNADTLNGGTALSTYLQCDVSLPASAATYYAGLALDGSAADKITVALFDNLNSQWYDWSTATWGTFNGESAFGSYRNLRVDRKHRFYQLQFSNGAVARTVRFQVKRIGAGNFDLLHGWIHDKEYGAPTFAVAGVKLGTPGNIVCAFGSLPAATKVATGVSAIITDSNTAVVGATAAAGGANRVRVNSDVTNWKVG